jgi:hypothetical protein
MRDAAWGQAAGRPCEPSIQFIPTERLSAAVHESSYGPSRRFAAVQQLGRFQGEADI